MKIPIETKPALWGVLGGAIAVAIVGFNWAGWVTRSTAEASAVARADEAVVGALAPVCVDRFQRSAEAAANLEALKKADTWSRGDVLEKGGWAAPPDSKMPAAQASAVARACAALLVPV